MNNGDRIRSMTNEELAQFINFDAPSCCEVCEDSKVGCASQCTHKIDKNSIIGDSKILEWLIKEIN